MSENLERVARAIFLKSGLAQDVAWEDADRFLVIAPWGLAERPPRVSDHYRDIARAAIDAYEAPAAGEPAFLALCERYAAVMREAMQ